MNVITTMRTWTHLLLNLVLLTALLILPFSSTTPAIASGSASEQEVTITLPRSETLYFNGLQWGSAAGWNPYSSEMNNSMAIAQQDNARVVMFETPYMYNMIDGKQYPLLADGDYAWNAERTEITFELKAAAHWSDGTPVTADDVAYTWAAHVMYGTTVAGMFQEFIQTVEAVDPQTVRVVAQVDTEGDAINPLMVSAYLSHAYVLQKAWTQKLEARVGYDADAFKADRANDVIASGPYKNYVRDNTRVVLIRDANYWGQDESMWGKLPAPKYLAHVIYPDNDAGTLALRTGKVDVSQQFNANVQDMWLVDHLPVSTYYPDAPYGITASLPTAFYNLDSYGLDQVAVRKAIAMAVDYDMIAANAITNQSPTFTQVPRSLMNPTPNEQALYDHAAVASLQWSGNEIAEANALLDTAGIVDTDSDGWREYNGQKLSYVATCPNGWTDWQAAVEVLAAVGESIGIEITTNYPEWSEYQTVVTNWPLAAGYDIFVMWSDGAGPTQPWGRIRHLISSEYAGTTDNWNGNWGGYINSTVDDLIQSIPSETDPTALKSIYTQLTSIYLTDVPSFTLMYRPQAFHTVSELVWTGFPKSDDGSNPPIPPLDLIDGYSVAGLYRLAHGPMPLTPAQDEYVASLTPTFDWQDMPGATGYTIQISTSSKFETIAHSANPVVSTYTPSVNLPRGDLYWRVRSKHANGSSTWSAVKSYQGPYPPAAPTLLLPANNAFMKDLTPLFKWSVLTIPAKAAPFDKYQLQVATDAAFNNLVLEEDLPGLTSNEFEPSLDLDPNTQYFWHVRGVNTLPENGPWSPTWTFRTGLMPVELNALPNSDHPDTLRPTLTWNDPNLAPLPTSYTVQVSSKSTFSTLLHSGTAVTGANSYTPNVNLPAGKLLYWRVRANGVNGPSLWTSRTFTTPTPPTTATLLLPANQSLNTNYTPTLKWSIVNPASGTTFDHYQVQVDDDPLFGTPIVDDVSLTLNTQRLFTTTSLPHNTRFYWRVLAFNNLGQYSTSAVWTFRTRIDAPILVAPGNDTTLDTLKPVFEWNAPAGPGVITGYTVQVSASPTFETLLLNTTTPNLNYTANKNLPAGKILYWRVRANGANGPSAWSLIFHFQIDAP